jgi:hypothetical protein
METWMDRMGRMEDAASDRPLQAKGGMLCEGFGEEEECQISEFRISERGQGSRMGELKIGLALGIRVLQVALLGTFHRLSGRCERAKSGPNRQSLDVPDPHPSPDFAPLKFSTLKFAFLSASSSPKRGDSSHT